MQCWPISKTQDSSTKLAVKPVSMSIMSEHGYPAIAQFIAQDPDHETFVFRRFDVLTARNLLNLQSELLVLQEDLAQIDKEANSGRDPELSLSMRSWRAMEEKAKSNYKVKESLGLAVKLEMKLKKYHKALLLSESVAKLESPDKRVLRAYQISLQDHLGDIEKASLSEAEDLVALKPPADRDALSLLLRKYWPLMFTGSARRGPENVLIYDGRRLTAYLSMFSFFLAVGLIVGPLVALNFIENVDARLGTAIAFIVAFALALSVSTGVSRDNMFIATATYSAVLVVFVSGARGNVSIL